MNEIKLLICPKCLKLTSTFTCDNCNGEWDYSETKQHPQKIYKVSYHDKGVDNIFYTSKYIETEYDYISDSLGSTFPEHNESLYVRMLELSYQLGNKINCIFCSFDWWKDYWQHFGGITHKEIKFTTKGFEVGIINEDKIVYVANTQQLKYWVAIECPMGVGFIDIKW